MTTDTPAPRATISRASDVPYVNEAGRRILEKFAEEIGGPHGSRSFVAGMNSQARILGEILMCFETLTVEPDDAER